MAEENVTYNNTSISSIPLQQVQAIPSSAGTSYEVLLEEIFEVSEPCDVETQKTLPLMKQAPDLLLSSPNSSPEKFIELASILAARSEELDGIVALELRQLAKHGRCVILGAPTFTD